MLFNTQLQGQGFAARSMDKIHGYIRMDISKDERPLTMRAILVEKIGLRHKELSFCFLL
jgi:hypothetical protein